MEEGENLNFINKVWNGFINCCRYFLKKERFFLKFVNANKIMDCILKIVFII